MKRKLTIMAACFALVLLLCAFGFANGTALAQEEGTQVGEEQEAEFSFSDYFQSQWLDKLVQYAFVLMGALTAIVATLRRVKAAHALLQKDGEQLVASQKDLQTAQRQLLEAQQTYRSTVEAVDKALLAIASLQEEEATASAQTQKALLDMQEALRLAFCTNPSLINAGVAKQIAQVLEADHETLL